MSVPPDMFARLQELSLLPKDDPQRMRFVAELAGADEETRHIWTSLLLEENLLRSALRQTEVPSNLLEQLKELPDESIQRKKSPASIKVPWPVAAAAAIAAVGVGGYLIWNVYQPPKTSYVQLPKAPVAIVDRITSLSLTDYMADLPLEIKSSDAKVVAMSLQAKIGDKMPFPVILPVVPLEFHLQGGSIITLGQGPAVYTSWVRDGHRYGLFQFPPANFGIPKIFGSEEPQASVNQPRLGTYRVALWPGRPDGICTWVAIGERTAPHDPFSIATY